MNFIINLLFNISEIIVWLVSAIYFYKVLICFASPKSNLIIRLLSMIGSFFFINTTIQAGDITNIIGISILFLAVMTICFKDALVQRMAVVFIILPLVIGINFLTESLGLQMYLVLGGSLREKIGTTLYQSSSYPIMDLAVHLFFNIMKAGFWFSLYHLLRHRLPDVKKLVTKPMWVVIGMICLSPLSGIIFLVSFTGEIKTYIDPVIIFSIITIVGILILTGYIARKVLTEKENRSLQFQQVYYAELEKNQRETAKLRHDMSNHLNVIAAFIENKDIVEAKRYHNGLLNNFSSKNRIFCKNSIVNAVINAKYNKAEEEQIDCFINIDLDKMISVDDISLCSIFANTLDNAVEACQMVTETSKRSIKLKARYIEGYFSYEISNTKKNNIIEKNGIIKTNKEDTKKHGYGLSNIRDIVETYNGVLEISHTENTFTVNILLKDL